MSKLAFMFPGQGSFELGMGREIAEAEPAAMAVYDEGSEASGLDLKELCFTGTAEELTRTDLQQPALVATSLAIDAALRALAAGALCYVAVWAAAVFLWRRLVVAELREAEQQLLAAKLAKRQAVELQGLPPGESDGNGALP